LIEPFLKQNFPQQAFPDFDEMLLSIVRIEPQLVGIVLDFLSLLPFLIGLVVFALQARIGFALRGLGLDSLYLPGKFREVITFVRSVQDGQVLKRKEDERP